MHRKKNTETPLGCVSKASHSSYLTSLHRSNDGNTMTHSRPRFHRHSSNHPERSPYRHTGNKWRCYWGHGGCSVFQHGRRSEHIYFWSDKVSHALLASNAWYFLNRTRSESVESADTLSQLHCHQSWRIIQMTNKPKAGHLQERAIELKKCWWHCWRCPWNGPQDDIHNVCARCNMLL